MKDIVKFIIVLLIIFVIISIFYIYSKDNESEVMSNDVVESKSNIIDKKNEEVNKIYKENNNNSSEKEEKVINKSENTVEKNKQEDKKEDISTDGNKGKAGNNKELTNEEKAIELVKEEYGVSDNTISYKIVNKDGANYTISVSSTLTTEVIAWYTANIETGKVTME